MSPAPFVRATVAAVLLIVPVSVQALAPDVADRVAGHLAFAFSQLVGWLLLVAVARAVKAPRRATRIGRGVVLAGIGCQVGFAAVYGITALDGEPLEASFVLFLLGFLAFAVGGITAGSSLVRRTDHRLAGGGLLGIGIAGLLAMLVGVDPFHDLFLLSSYAAWPVLGRALRASASRPADPVMAG